MRHVIGRLGLVVFVGIALGVWGADSGVRSDHQRPSDTEGAPTKGRDIGESMEWITPAFKQFDTKRRPTWWIRRCFDLKSKPETFTVSIVCLGYYELYVNGKQVENAPLSPPLSRLDKRGFVIQHDIAPFLREGTNCIGIWTSSGWYLPWQFPTHEGASPLLSIKTSQKLHGANDKWLAKTSNRWVLDNWKWGQFGGEEVDARKDVPDWNRISCDEKDWKPVETVSKPPIKITPLNCPQNRIGETYAVTSVQTIEASKSKGKASKKSKKIRKDDQSHGEPGGKVYTYDFGTCLAGWVDVTFPTLTPGQKITLTFSEVANPRPGRRSQAYNQISIYYGRGSGVERFVNKFNYAGFRYLLISGLDTAPDKDKVKAYLVESDMKPTGKFACSQSMYNSIHKMNLQTLRCLNIGGYSADCPQRERLGYGADGQTSMPAYLYMMDCQAFLSKWLVDWCDMSDPETGKLPHTAPHLWNKKNSPAWGGIVVPMAWNIYLYYGDKEPMEKALPVIEGYLKFCQQAVDDKGVLRAGKFGSKFIGDWVPPGRGMKLDSANSRELFNSCYLIYLWQTYQKICGVLNKGALRNEAQAHIDTLRKGIHKEFYDAGKGVYMSTDQAHLMMPLMAGAVPEDLRKDLHAKLLKTIESNGWHVGTGLPGTTFLLNYLIQTGEHEVIAKIFAQDTYPSWGYMIAKGATTIWEEWDGGWSLIHSCFAGPAVWFYQGLAGIKPYEKAGGFKSFTLEPAFVSGVDHADASFESAAGLIKSSWNREGGKVTWSINVPEKSTATIILPKTATEISVGDKLKTKSSFTLSGGTYVLTFSLR